MDNDEFRQWARRSFGAQSRVAPARTFEDALLMGESHGLAHTTGLPIEAAAWLAGVLSNLRRTHRGMLDEAAPENRFIYTWASLAPDLGATRRHINESRFNRWLKRWENWPDWYASTLEGLKVIYGHVFDVASLLELAQNRVDESLPFTGLRSFSGLCGLEFYSHQPKGADGLVPPQRSLEDLLTGGWPGAFEDMPPEKPSSLYLEIPPRKKVKWVKAAQRAKMKLVPWVIQALDEASGEKPT